MPSRSRVTTTIAVRAATNTVIRRLNTSIATRVPTSRNEKYSTILYRVDRENKTGYLRTYTQTLAINNVELYDLRLRFCDSFCLLVINYLYL